VWWSSQRRSAVRRQIVVLALVARELNLLEVGRLSRVGQVILITII
jgi:hypothetical protein